MTFNIDGAPALVSALISLRGETLKSVSDATTIKSANLSVWLRGKEQVISKKRIVVLLSYLGVVGGSLKSDSIHRWSISENFTALNVVLANLLTAEQKVNSIVCSDGNTNFPYLRFLGLASDSGYRWVELCVQAGMGAALLLRGTDIGFDYEHILPINFGVLSSCDKPAVEEMLLASIAKLGVNSDPALVKNLSYQTAIDHPLYSEAADMVTLRAMMQRVIDSGVSPEKITNLLAAHFLK